MEDSINRENLIGRMREFLPEIEDLYQQSVNDLKRGSAPATPTNYEVVGFALRPCLQEEVSKGKITDFLRRFASFCERVCTSGDIEAINVIWVKIFEWLMFHPNELRLLWPILGPLSRSNIRDAAHRWSEAARSGGKMDGLPEDNVPV